MAIKLPLFELVINENDKSELQVDYIALVDRPAIERDFMKFDEHTRLELKFAAVDDERHIISGPAMLTDMPIYRKEKQPDGTFKEFMVVFREATIYTIVQKFFDKGFNKNFNIMHEAELAIVGVSIFESFIVDSARGILPMAGFEDAANGSWFISAKVTNEKVWQGIKEGLIKGFSVEGNFGFIPVDEGEQLTEDDDFETQLIKIKEVLATNGEDFESALAEIKTILN